MSDDAQAPSSPGPTTIEIQAQVDAWELEADEAEARAKAIRGWRTETLALYIRLHGSTLPDGRRIARVRHGYRLEAPKAPQPAPVQAPPPLEG